jgi:predicted nuclease of restriction endonuclease-like (RecB) superfamily
MQGASLIASLTAEPHKEPQTNYKEMSMTNTPAVLPLDYTNWLSNLKQRINDARQRAVFTINHEQIQLYHDLGKDILGRQNRQGWGAKVIDKLSSDLRVAFPKMKGLSTSNLKYMRFFAQECPDLLIGQQPADQLPWFHIVTILTKITDPNEREWYALRTAKEGWPRTTLEMHIKNKLHLRQGAAINNFKQNLSETQASLATQILKDPYHFDFLGLGDEAHEQDIESALIRHITRFLLELGVGFAFVGRQFRLEVEGDEFFIDLLFYHTRLKSYVVVELKATDFKPEHAGQLNFYLAAVDNQIKAPDDHPTIGLLLCKTKKRLVAEYALSGINKPMGVAEYDLVHALPTPLDINLPSIEKLEEALSLPSIEELAAALASQELKKE